MKIVRSAVMTLMLAFIGSSALAANDDALTKDLQRYKQVESNMKMVFWLPPEFFIGALPPGTPVSQQNKFIAMMDGYVLFLVADVELGALGGITPKPRSQTVASARLTLNGSTLSPLPDNEVRGEMKTLIEMFRPLFKNMMGNFGEAIEPVVFKAPKGIVTAELAKSSGRMSLKLRDEPFDWRLPIGSLLPPAIDPDTGDQFPGDYRFSPYTGRALTPKR